MQFCVSASDGGQQGPRHDREGGTGPLGAATAGGQGDFLSAVQWSGGCGFVRNPFVIHSFTPYVKKICNKHTK